MKNLLKDKKIVIVDVETSGLWCGEYYAVYYNRNAQEFIVNHIQSIT